MATFMTNEQIQRLQSVTAESLAAHAGAVDDGHAADYATGDGESVMRLRYLKWQLGMVQQRPQYEQMPLFSEVAAKYLPALAERYRETPGPLTPPMVLLNIITATPYFVRFLNTPAAQGLAALHMKRVTEARNEIDNMKADDVAEIGQFLATLFALQGIDDVDPKDVKLMTPKFKQWQRTFPGRLAGEVGSRCLMILKNDGEAKYSMKFMRNHVGGTLSKCGAEGCGRTTKADGKDLMQCSRCKTAVYCGQEHQKQSWSTHKRLCFPCSF